MKTKQMFLVAMTAVLGAFGAGQAWANSADENTHLTNFVRIESITKVSSTGGVNLPLSPNTTPQIYFDVKLTDTDATPLTQWTFQGNSYTPTAGERPYLVLNIPLKGMSSKDGVTLAAGEAATVSTVTAVAYYAGQSPVSADTLRFVYNVRSGDMTEAITWDRDAATSAPLFGGKIGAITLNVAKVNVSQAVQVSMLEAAMVGRGVGSGGEGTAGVAEDAARKWPVSGYTFVIGDQGNFNEGSLYQGLVPVTVSTPENAAAAVFTNTALANQCYFWVESVNGGGVKTYYKVGVTPMTSDSAVVVEGDYTNPSGNNFDIARAGRFIGPTNAGATTFESKKFFLNIPASIPVGTSVRLCYGVRDDNTTSSTTFAYVDYTVVTSPVIANANTSGYEVASADMTATNTLVLPGSGLKYVALQNQTVAGGILNAGAGETVTLTIAKNNIDTLLNAGILYADIEQISSLNDAKATFERYTVPLNPDLASGNYTVKLTIGANAKNGTSYFRIRIPGLDDPMSATTPQDTPFYLQVISSPKRERITFENGEGNDGLGTEFYQPTDTATGAGTATILEYKLTVQASESARNFLVYPVASDLTTRINPEATFTDRTTNGVPGGPNTKVFDALSKYVVLQSQKGSVLPGATPQLVVRVPAGATSASFYAVCVNDYPLNAGLLNGAITTATGATTMAGAVFVAKGCDSSGNITGTNDESLNYVQPNVQNRAPSITSSSAPTSGATGAPLNWTFSVADVVSDYLVAQMNYGDGNIDTVLYATDADMIALMGKALWDAELASIVAQYGGVLADYQEGTGARRKRRSTLGSENVTFTHTYTGGTAPAWSFVIRDSSRAQANLAGQLTLQTSQLFTFNTVSDATVPGTGYVLWGNQAAGDMNTWSFGETYTYNALTKNGGNTTVTIQAMPFPAGTPSPTNYTEISATRDSFFYRWAAATDYATLLPAGDDPAQNIYSRTIHINRAFVKGGGQADDPAKWQDIVLSAVFVAEWLPGDAITSYTKSRTAPYLYELGDYNSDGVPDGWLLSNLGATNGRTAAEGNSIANAMPAEDRLPFSNFAGGDAAYTFGNSTGRLGYPGNGSAPGPCSIGTNAPAFGYRLRLRGRDNALNAADGAGNWLSVPAWVVLVRPEQADGIVRVGNLANGTLTEAWTKVSLASSTNTPVAGVTVAFTAANKIPYNSANIPTTGQNAGWAYVIDSEGYPIQAAAGGRYKANNVKVQTNPDSPDYERFRYTYNRWGYNIDGGWNNVNSPQVAQDATGMFPFTTAETTAAAMVGNVNAYTGTNYLGSYRFVDARVPAGMLIDEPFLTDDAHRAANRVLDPRRTSWLDRFPATAGNPADVDNDGINNGTEYFFWYYASRIAYGSVYRLDGNVQINDALFPAIDLRDRVDPNTDENLGTTERFMMGRRYRNGYVPDAETASFYAANGGAGNATAGKGNYWEPIPAAQVLSLFDPYVAAAKNADPDNDGLSIIEEIAIGTNPIDCDTDNDWIIDGWEAAYGLDPLNVEDQNNPNDAEKNPDNDYYAVAELVPYPDYHHLFQATYTGAPADHAAYFDYEGQRFYFVATTADLSVLAQADDTVVAGPTWEDGKGNVTGWANVAPIFMQMTANPVRLRDLDVYRALGFNKFTGWGVKTDNITAAKFADFVAVNTAPFVSREEFNSAVARGNGQGPGGILNFSSSPVNADTNGDGIPDGWAAYVGLRPHVLVGVPQDGTVDQDADTLTAAQEFHCRAANLVAAKYGWPASLTDALHDTTWVNKIYPTDPWNPDTDLDGVWDGSEGNARYIYGTPGDSSWVGGGCNPTSMDTDGDGMPDGWEYRYGIASTVATTPPNEDADLDPDEILKGETADGQYVIPSGAPDPTSIADYDLDYDRDGLPNYQEYLTGLLRHLRYDLGPESARLYKDIQGKMQEVTRNNTTQVYEWTQIPNVYVATEDLLNPQEARSVDFDTYAPVAGDLLPVENVIVSPLIQAMSSNPVIAAVRKIDSVSLAQSSLLKPVIATAFNRAWNATIAFPTEEQTDAYSLNVLPTQRFEINVGDPDNPVGMTPEYETYLAVRALQRAFVELDMAYERLMTNALIGGDRYGNPLLNAVYTNLDLCERQVRAQIWRIDQMLTSLRGTDNLQPVLKALLAVNGETATVWAARKNQLLKFFNNLPRLAPADPAYTGMQGLTQAETATYTTNDPTDYAAVADIPDSAYETAVFDATSPLLWTRYRAAVRGFTGGMWVENRRTYLGNLGMHLPLRNFRTAADDGRERLVDSFWLGVPVQDAITLGAYMPQVSTQRDFFMTTSPLVADTDMDGMDDFWEIFHGLNPLLGDYANAGDSNGDPSSGNNYTVNKLGSIYSLSAVPGEQGGFRSYDSNAVFGLPSPTVSNPFLNPALETGAVTGYDYYTYPWLAGVPFADPDGDGLLNFEEAVNPSASDPAHYGTDPSPLWMTDPANPNSFVARFYGSLNMNLYQDVPVGAAVGGVQNTISGSAAMLYRPTASFTYVGRVGDLFPGTGAFQPYEINEGFDTDGDGIGDLTELSATTIFRGDPQALRTPDRQQAAYFGGVGVMQSHAETQFGPMALTTFTLECWVKPDAEQATNGDVILIDRPWRFNEGAIDSGELRHNFVLGLRPTAGGFLPFVYYTGAGTNTDGSAGTPQASPTVVAGELIKADEWNHIAATYNGSKLAIVLNGVENSAASCALIPANGVLSLKNDGLDDVQRFTYRRAPLLVGAGPATSWFSSLGDPDDDFGFTDYYAGAYKGFIDEVRIWNGARTATQIADSRRSSFSQADLLKNRYDVFLARYQGQGYYQPNTPAELLAMYTFNDLLAGTRIPAQDTTPATAAGEPWERWPGQKLIGDATVPGSFTYRRKGLVETLGGDATNALITPETLPTSEELFTSYYTLTASKNLRSKQYCENPNEIGVQPPRSEFVPMAHNTVSHLPLPDVERSYSHLLHPLNLRKGSPTLRSPSGDPSHLKVADSVYWSPYAAGKKVSATAIYNVKTTGNPYGYFYRSVIAFDVLNYTVRSAYSTQTATDLLIYGDVFSKYDFESWDNSPSTDPSAGKPDEDTTVKEDPDWFEHNSSTGDNLNDDQLSNGGNWLDDNIANGQTKDTDGDRMPNWWENYYGLDPEDPVGVNGPHGDADGDFLTNYAEYLARANPGKYSTAGTGVPDYHVPIWYRRGRPTLGLLYTDNDFMEDHWEASNRSERLSVDFNDAQVDADGDGWSNWAELRTTFRGRHSTDPNAVSEHTATGVQPAYPTPILRLKVDYFGDLGVVTNAQNNIVVQAYTAKNNNSAPDATFLLPMAVTTDVESTTTQVVGNQILDEQVSGYLEPGNIKPGTIEFRSFRYVPSDGTTEGGMIEGTTWAVRDNAKGVLLSPYQITQTNPATGEEVVVHGERDVGTIDYATGRYTYLFSSDFWSGEFVNGGLMADNTFRATYSYMLKAGFPAEYTMASPSAGHLREGINNFFVFMDLNGNGSWNDGEPAGIPDQHDVDIGFDIVNKPLHVALTGIAPPGSVRLDVKSILDVLMSEGSSNSEETGDTSSIMNPSTGKPLQPSKFASGLKYELILTPYENLSTGDVTTNPPTTVYRKQYNVQKPYLTEDEIFGSNPEGLPGTAAVNQKATSYKVFMVPETVVGGGYDRWVDYNIAVVTNFFGSLDDPSTAMVNPVGGSIRHNTELTFEWKCNVQVPTFTLAVTKTGDAAGNPVNATVYSETVRGVTPSATDLGTGSVVQYRYRYVLPRGIGELNKEGTSVFGDGSYAYTLSLKPYNGSPKVLTGNFRIQLNASGDADMTEYEGAVKDTSYNAQDSYYVRSRIRYNGVLANSADFGGRRILIEAHYSSSFNGDPIASTSDLLVYDDDTNAEGDPTADAEAVAKLNRCVRMRKDKTYEKSVAGAPATVFWSTRFDTELRGLPTADPVYLIAYLDLNGNGKRDAWEPWGYATQGLDAFGGYYFDPRPVTPVANGKDFLVEFYIQDVDTDNDKLADSWEWLSAGKPTSDFSAWCDRFTGSLSDHQSTDIWVRDAAGGLSLTAYGAQLYGLKVIGEPDANGAVKVEGLPEDAETARELISILGDDTALKLFADGYLSYGLSVNGIGFDGDSVTLSWDVTSATGVADGATYDLTEIFAGAKSANAVYAVYGKATLSDTSWTKLGEVKVSGTQTPKLSLPKSQAEIVAEDGTGKTATFFKVILSAKTPESTLAE